MPRNICSCRKPSVSARIEMDKKNFNDDELYSEETSEDELTDETEESSEEESSETDSTEK